MKRWIDKILGPDESAASRLEKWLNRRAPGNEPLPRRLDAAFASMRCDGAQDNPLPESLAADAAEEMGNWARGQFGGEWNEDDLLGELLVSGVGGLPQGKLLVLPLIETAWQRGEPGFLEGFMRALPARLEAERERASRAEKPAIDPPKLSGVDGNAAASDAAKAFGIWFADSAGASLPMTLNGLRELDRFLRSHYYFNCLAPETLWGAGFMVGEVTRGLFGGSWSLKAVPPMEKAALCWVELPYYPIGRILRMMTERPTGEPLDEYVRLVPDARRALREQQKATDPKNR